MMEFHTKESAEEEPDVAKQTKQARPQLYEGETLIWTGSPCEDKDYGKIDWILLPISALLLAVSALFGTVVVFSILRRGFSVRHLIELLLLLCVGGFAVYSYFLRFAAKRRIKADLAYGVTSQGRVLIRDNSAQRLIAYEGRQLRDARVTEVDSRGVGTIYLQRRSLGNLFDNTGMEFLGLKDGSRIALYDVPDCEKVLRLIRGKNR